MCIKHAVGLHRPNHHDDVKVVQLMLTLNLYRMPPFPYLQIDGKFSTNLHNMIEMFQRRVLNAPKPDGKVDVHGATIKALRSGMPSGLNDIKMQGIFLHAPVANINRYYSALTSSMIAVNINTPLRMAHFLSQLGHESVDLQYAEEIAPGDAYEGRTDLGNTQVGDGRRFKGRGLIQLTGRANYSAYGTARGKDYVTNNNWLKISTDPALAVDVSTYFWDNHNLNNLADHDSVSQVTLMINGGSNGLADRTARLARAKCFLLPA